MEEAVVGNLKITLSSAVTWLLKNRQPQGHWGDVRGTAIACWALSDVIRGRNAPRGSIEDLRATVRKAAQWLVGQARKDDGALSWESEAWDTSLAIIAITGAMLSENAQGGSLRKSDDHVESVMSAAKWLQAVQCERTRAWYDEVWETSLAVIALMRAQEIQRGPTKSLTADLGRIMAWFNGLPSNERGLFIVPHYSGFIAWLLAEMRASPDYETICRQASFPGFVAKVDRAAKWLVWAARRDIANTWSTDTFANAYAAYGVAKLYSIADRGRGMPDYRRRDRTFVSDIITWFHAHRGKGGGFEDTEDTGLAILALSACMDLLDIDYPEIVTSVRSGWARVPCFLAYAGKARAKAVKVKAALDALKLPIQVIDWWDYSHGRSIFDQVILDKGEECSFAIVIATPDEVVKTRRGETRHPRDNILLEIGYFYGKFGEKNVILLVDGDTELPADIRDRTHIPLQVDARSMPTMMKRLEKAIREIIRYYE